MAIAAQTSFSQSGNFFGHREGSHFYGEQDYLHYYANDAPEAMSWMYGVIAQTKAQAMVGIRSNLKKRKRQALGSLRLSREDQEIVDSIEDGTFFQGLGDLGNIKSETSDSNDITSPSTIEQARAMIKDIDVKVASVDDFILELYKAIEQITGICQQSLKDIGTYIVEQAATQTHHQGIATHAKRGGGVQSAILEAVLAKYNQGFFQTMGKSQNVHTDIAKMLAVAESLSEPALSKTYNVRHGSGKAVTTGKAKGKNQILETLQDKFLKYFTEIEKATAETAVVVAALKAHPKLFKELEKEVHHRIRQSGNANVGVNLNVDSRQQALIEQAGLELSRMTTKRMKSDVSIEVMNSSDENAKVIGQVGLSVKDYKDLKMSEDGTQIISGNLDIQKGTPLLTALMREANVSGQNLHYIYQFAGAHTYGDGMQENKETGDSISWDDNYDQAWAELIQYLSYRMFVNALVGLEGTLDQAMYLVINRRIYDVVDFVNSFIGSKQSEIRISEYLGEYTSKQASGGLIRSTYVQANKWETLGDYQGRNKILAKKRSEKAEAAISRIMGATKLRISLNLMNMQNLRALNF